MESIFVTIQYILIFFIAWPVTVLYLIITSPGYFEKDVEEHLCKVRQKYLKNNGKINFFISVYIFFLDKKSRWLVSFFSCILLGLLFFVRLLFK